MSFSYNKDLVLEVNNQIEEALKKVYPSVLFKTIEKIAKETLSLQVLKDEFKTLQQMSPFEVTAEHITNVFIISNNGVELIWKAITNELLILLEYKEQPLYKNVYAYLEELVDMVQFESLFEKELVILNTKETWE